MSRFLPSRSGRFRQTSAAAEALDQHLTTAIAEMSPPPLPAPSQSEKPTMTNPAAAHLNVKQMMEDHVRLMGEIHATQLELLKASLERQRDTVAKAVGSVASKIDGQTDDFMAMMGQFTNDLGT